MPCYFPVTLYKSRLGPNRDTGKWSLVGLRDGYCDRPQIVPCSRCIGCRLERSRQWAVRCMHESQFHDRNCFITLTYRQDELIYGGNSTGTLYPRHLTLFFKRLRKEYGNGIRYFACGEYGELYRRPHYHAAMFGIDFSDKQISGAKNGNDYYCSDSLNRIWSHGDCIIGALTFDSAAYVARYIMGKHLGLEADYYEREGIAPEFVRMSRRPGIGTNWYDRYSGDILRSGHLVVRGHKSSVPRFYNLKLEVQNPQRFSLMREKRLVSIADKWRDNTPARLAVRYRVRVAQTSSLVRDLG